MAGPLTRLSEIADEVGRTHERVDITRSGRYVVLPAAEELESIEATLELLSDPAAQERIRRSQGKSSVVSLLDEDEVRAVLAQRRMPDK